MGTGTCKYCTYLVVSTFILDESWGCCFVCTLFKFSECFVVQGVMKGRDYVWKGERRGLNVVCFKKMFMNLPQENEQDLGKSRLSMPRSDILPMCPMFYSFFQETTFWTPCSDAICGGCCSGRLQQLQLVNRGRCLRTTTAQIHGKAEVRRITVVSHIVSPSLCARGTSSFTYCMKTSFCRSTGVYLPSYPLPKAYIICGRGWTRIPSKRTAHIALISLQHFQQLRQEYSSSFCYDYIHHAAYVSVKNRDWYTWLMIISCRGRTVNVCT